ncbi:SMODS domain-containing nucleotidyltransferase [Dietzia kunjamensis]|uniref:SMODS domain-containing nucleotidyltransferase n=1 Tax=Dietzia kunjamensis TaxID=322509 RepID=UPI00388E2EFC
MAPTIASAFDEFYVSIAEDNDTRAKVSQRKTAVVNSLMTAFPSSSTMQYQSTKVIGSLGRHTASRPFDDIDLLVHLHVDPDLWSSSYQTNSSSFLYRVRQSLNDASTVRKIGTRGQAVRLFYADGLSVDVAAVVKYSGGGYGIPDGSGGWLNTNPLEHESYMNRRNSELGGNLKRFVVIAKQWNRAHSSRLSSFHLEMLAARSFSSLGANRRTALRMFFDHNQYNLSVLDPAGFGGDISNYLTDSARSLVNQSLGSARARADLAIAAEDRGDHEEAIRQWGIILGDRFPAYG